MTISDVIKAKNRLVNVYKSPEYRAKEIKRLGSILKTREVTIEREIALNDLVLELMNSEQMAESAGNIES